MTVIGIGIFHDINRPISGMTNFCVWRNSERQALFCGESLSLVQKVLLVTCLGRSMNRYLMTVTPRRRGMSPLQQDSSI
jgi:hypothetical protein